jgi:hypothetical protein
MNTMNTMMDTFHFDVASPTQSITLKRKHQSDDDEDYKYCVTPTPTYSPYNNSPHKTTRIFRRSQSPPPLRRMTDEDRMNLFASSMDEEALSFLSFPSLKSTSSSGSGSTTTQAQQENQESTSLLPSSSPPTIFNLAPRTTLPPRCFALPEELEIMKSRSLFDDDEDSDSDDIDDDLTPPLLQTCLSFDSDNDDAKNDFDFARQRSRAQSPLKALFHDHHGFSSGPLQMRKAPRTTNNQSSSSLFEYQQKQLKIELSMPKGLKLHHGIHHGTPLKAPQQHQRKTYPAIAA